MEIKMLDKSMLDGKKLLNKFYLDKEKDIQIFIYKQKGIDEIVYIIRTPNHKTGNLIKNIAKVFGVNIVKEENEMLAITGVLEPSINSDNEEVYIFRLNGIKIANIYENKIEVKAKITTIVKTLMSQTKNHNMDIKDTVVKSYIKKKSKFRTDLHTHMNANLSPFLLISLGIKNQIRYPLYYIKKLELQLTKKQEKAINEQRKLVEEKILNEFKNKNVTNKYLTRKIDDNTYINFADLILKNEENQEENLRKIAKSLVILKDGQAVFTNLEKLYLYRYVFAKPTRHDKKIKLQEEDIKNITNKYIVKYLKKMLEDIKKGSIYANNTLKQDKLLWIARQYQKQGIYYAEISDTDLVKKGSVGITLLEEIHEIMPKIEKETNVKIRFLAAIRRIPLTIVKDQITSNNYLQDNLEALESLAKSPYIVGSDFVGEEINDITELKPVIEYLVQYVNNKDKDFTIRIHAGENDSLRSNVRKSMECIVESVKEGQIIPRFRLGHGLYTEELTSEEGKELMKELEKTNAILEFQLTSNIRLNNLSKLHKHPLKKYLTNGIKCVQGTDGCGFYGTDTVDEQLAIQNLLKLNDEDFAKMRKVEDEIINHSNIYFEKKSKEFEKFLNGRSITNAFTEFQESFKLENRDIKFRINDNLDSNIELKEKIGKLPKDKMPIIIAGGSFNSKNRKTLVEEKIIKELKNLVKELDEEKVYFVIGHRLEGYEKEICEIVEESKKNIEIHSIIPNMIAVDVKDRLLAQKALTHVCISNESEELRNL